MSLENLSSAPAGALADHLSTLASSDSDGLTAVRAVVDALAERSPIGIAILLREGSAALSSILGGTADDPESTKAAAARFLRAAHTEPVVAPKSAATFAFDDADRELVSEFVQEATDYVTQAEAAMLVLENAPDDGEAVDTVFRAFHTVKGVSAMLGLDPIASFAHKAESLLSRVRAKELHFSGKIADLSLASVDAIKGLITGLQTSLSGEAWEAPSLAELSQALVDATAPPVADATAGAAGGAPKKPRAKGKQKQATHAETIALIPLEQPPSAPAPVNAEPVTALVAPVAASAPAAPAAGPAAPPAAPRAVDGSESSVRVRTERLDRLVDMVGELVIAHSMVRQDPTVVGGEHHDLSRKISHAGKIVRELQELAMSLRMVPLKPTFQKMARVVRDTAQKSGKEVELVLSGEDTEIDRNMVDVVADPLVHMLRNAVDHGIETPTQRLSVGKRRNGSVRLSASHAGGNVVVELADNGAGLDRGRIVKKAMERGLIESDAGMSDSDVFNLIFEPGFSTCDTVSDLSGRGVGMDVVRRNVQALNGRIEIASVLGQGTTFTLRLPLTLAVTDGMLVRVGSERYIVPTVNIRTSLRPLAENISTVAGKGELLFIRGELIPMFRLHRLFGVATTDSDPTKALAVIINGVEGQCAILVDELLGQQQVVAKPLGHAMGPVRGIAGGAILGDGRVGLILDTPEIIALARDDSRSIESVN